MINHSEKILMGIENILGVVSDLVDKVSLLETAKP
jgi:hypothetical protein